MRTLTLALILLLAGAVAACSSAPRTVGPPNRPGAVTPPKLEWTLIGFVTLLFLMAGLIVFNPWLILLLFIAVLISALTDVAWLGFLVVTVLLFAGAGILYAMKPGAVREARNVTIEREERDDRETGGTGTP